MEYKLKVHNNLTGSKGEFKTLEDNKVSFYSCGPTTYDFLHVGNARAFVVGDLFNRILRALGYDVKFVRNFTDVDDKIIKKANELGVDPLDHSKRFIDECLKDYEYLGMKPADVMPTVSGTMDEIIKMVEELVENGTAYEVDGEVFYHVPKFDGYGKLSNKKLEDLEHGKRVDVDDRKKHPSDFVLWKPAKEGEPSWDSPWGKGRPGWHIECSAMARKHLGTTIDLHHGGIDLVFPHHENEIAQSEAANGKEFCKHWCHNEFVNFGSEKMSKSLGNVITIRKFAETYGGEVLRQILASVQYRSKMEWSEELIERSISDVERIHQFKLDIERAEEKEAAGEEVVKRFSNIIHEMKLELCNDFNVPGALGLFFSMIRDVRRDFLDKKNLPKDVKAIVIETLDFTKDALGLVYDDAKLVLEHMNNARRNMQGSDSGSLSAEDIDQLIIDRKQARVDKNWGRADEIRDILKENKVVVLDNPDGTTTWKYE